MLNSSTNFFGLICIIFMSSVVLANWETPFADVQMLDIWSDFYGTCAAVATNILFHIVYPMPSSRHNLYRGLAQRIRAAALRASQYTEHFLNLYGSTDRDDRAFLPSTTPSSPPASAPPSTRTSTSSRCAANCMSPNEKSTPPLAWCKR